MKHRDEVIHRLHGPGGPGWKTWRVLFFYRWLAWSGENAAVRGYKRGGGFALTRGRASTAAGSFLGGHL